MVPVVWVVAAGFRTQISLLIGEFFFTPNLDNFREVLFSKTSDFLLNYRNSVIVGLASTLLCLARRDAGRMVAAPHALAASGCRRSFSLGDGAST